MASKAHSKHQESQKHEASMGSGSVKPPLSRAIYMPGLSPNSPNGFQGTCDVVIISLVPACLVPRFGIVHRDDRIHSKRFPGNTRSSMVYHSRGSFKSWLAPISSDCNITGCIGLLSTEVLLPSQRLTSGCTRYAPESIWSRRRRRLGSCSLP